MITGGRFLLLSMPQPNYATDDYYLEPPTPLPTPLPTRLPKPSPTVRPSTRAPTVLLTKQPTLQPTPLPTTYPTTVPSPAPTSHPTPLPTLQPTELPTVNPTIAPSSAPTLQPTLLPIVLPTELPTAYPTIEPSFVPTLQLTTIPTPLPTYLQPTANPSTAPSFVSTLQPTLHPSQSPVANSPTLAPYIAMPSVTPTGSIITSAVENQVSKLYAAGEYYIKSTGAGRITREFLDLSNPTREEVENFCKALSDYKTNLSPAKIWLIGFVDILLRAAEYDYRAKQLGNTELSSDFKTERQDGADVVTVSSALGNGNITTITHDGYKNITGIFGNENLRGFTYLNVTTKAQTSLSEQMHSLMTQLGKAIGVIPLEVKSITVSACDASNNIIYPPLYSVSSSPSEAEGMHVLHRCAKWVATNHIYSLADSNDGADCVEVTRADAFRECLQYIQTDDAHDLRW